MARRRKAARGRRALIVSLALLLIGIALWQYLGHNPLRWPALPAALQPAVTGEPVSSAAATVDPANEGRRLRLAGTLRVMEPARDREMGISAAAPALLRKVEMRQWLETCTGGQCSYALGWAEQPVDASRFRTPAGHANAAPWPLHSARFVAGSLRLGAFTIEPALLPVDGTVTTWPVTLAQLPPNLAASFRSEAGALLTGDPAHPAVGDLRVSYAVAGTAPLVLVGTQRGSRLVVTR